MAREQAPKAGEIFRVREGFAVPGGDGFMRTYPTGSLIDGSDPVAKSHKHMMEPAAGAVEQASAAPGERRALGLRLPSGRSLADVTAHNEGHAHHNVAGTRVPTNLDTHEGDSDMPHALPPEHPDSPASTFAPDQPGRGVVADDVPTDEQKTAAARRSTAETAADATVKDAEAAGGDVKRAKAAAKVAKDVAKSDAQRAEERQPDTGDDSTS